jgi:hypothetical protein
MICSVLTLSSALYLLCTSPFALYCAARYYSRGIPRVVESRAQYPLEYRA